ncbi:TetR/AcrR family transcriptional regulator [Microbacterium deminutum]|uniref:TetR/AcrR family transcriptional regulator n=1 Tax=Microbacterium deminutum TaxID=344164 RepID=A0ABN2R5J7_9MICO
MSTSTVPQPRRQYAKTAQRRADIIEAATTVFSSRGYHGGSLRDIARELDLSLTSLVHHFPTKSELLVAVLEHADSQATWFPEYAEDHGLQAATLKLWGQNYDHPELLRLLAIVAAEASAPEHPAHTWFVHRYQRTVEGFAEAIRNDQSRGRISSSTDPTSAARLVAATWDGLQLQWLLDPSRDLTSDFRNHLSQLLAP